MGDFDPQAVGLKVGLEIHQQLGRPGDSKLFCRCPADILENDPDLVVQRTLRASAGETGAVDVAARVEQTKQKSYHYHAFHGQTCLVELDEEPPHPVNQEVVETAIMVAKAFNSTILPCVQFMRKTIVDGSAVSGFQRTGLFAIGGEIPGLTPPVRIQTLGIEEDSAKIVKRTHDADVYNLTRLGIPLLEIATAPDITTPEQAKEVAAQLGMVLRSTHRVKRGLGTIRQDLNVSVKGGARCEIKGAQDLRMIPTIIEYEARRQQSLLEIKEQLGTDYIVVSDPIDVTEHFKGGKGFIKNALTKGKAIGVRVEGFKGVFGKELCPGYRVGTEFADIAKTWGFGGVIHSDEDMNKYGIDVGDAFELNANDAFIVLLGNPKRINKLIDTLFVPRIQQFLNGVPQEVRKANANGTTSYLRPVPGAARMYPETDIPVVEIDHSKTEAPKLLTERAEDLVKETGLSNDLVKEILAKNIPITEYKKEYPALDYAFLSSALVEWPREIASRLKKDVPHTAYVEPLLGDVASGKLAKSSVKAILEQAVQNDIPATEVPKLMAKYEQLPLKKLNKIINDVVENNKGAPLKALMGLVMKEVHGKADGKLVMQLLEEKHARSL